MKVAALDLGSNTFLLLICEVVANQITSIYADEVRTVRLGQEVNKTKRFHPEALRRAENCLEEFSQIISKHRPEKIQAMATSAARDVTNSHLLFELGEKYKIPIQIIPGEKEAAISYSGATSGVNDNKSRLVVDIGGGSTELILGKGKTIMFGESLNIGGVRLKELCLRNDPPTSDEVNELNLVIIERSKKVLEQIQGMGPINEILAVAGTPTELARIEIGGTFSAAKIDGQKISLLTLQTWFDRFRQNSAQMLIEKYQLSPGRADIIIVGTAILIHICKTLCLDHIIVSTRGVRHGIALDSAGK